MQPPYYNQPTYNNVPPMPPQRPPRKNWIRRHPVWTCIIVFICLSAIVGTFSNKSDTATTDATPVSTPTTLPATATPTHTPTWTTTQTFTGKTHGKTPYFTMKAGWRLKWKCTNSTVGSGATGAVGITAYDHTGKTLSGTADDPTVATGHCPPTFFGTTGTSDVQKYGGTMYLDVYITGDWTIDIQELK